MNGNNADHTLKKNWRSSWLSSINELTDLELQKKAWLDPELPSPHWSFVEFMCAYFDDLGIDNNYADPLKRGFLSKEEFKIISLWHRKLSVYNSPNNKDHEVAHIVNDPKWISIIENGLTAKAALAKRLDDEEKDLLLGKIDYLKL